MTVYAGIPSNMFFDPNFWDNTTLLIPVWMWILLIEMFIGFVVLVGIIYVWVIMRPVAGFGKVGDASTAKGSPTQTYSIWKNRSFVIESMWYYGNMLSYGDPIKQMQMWFHNSEKATGTAAGKPVMITRDGFSGTVDLIAEMAMCQIPRIWNKIYGFEKKQRIDPETGSPMVDKDYHPIYDEVPKVDKNGNSLVIANFSDIRKRWNTLQAKFPEGIPIKIYNLYDLSEVYQWTPQDEDALKFGADLVEEAKEWAKEEEHKEQGFLDKYGFLLICGLIGLASLGIVAYICHFI